MTLVNCYYCGCPVKFDPSGKLEAIGVTLDVLNRHNLAIICNLCTDMAETEDSNSFEIIDEHQLKARLNREVA